jgi:hypothetical protein
VGLVEEAPGNEFRRGDMVATAMGDDFHVRHLCVPPFYTKTCRRLETGGRPLATSRADLWARNCSERFSIYRHRLS